MKPSTRILLMQKRLLTPIFLGSRLALWLDASDSSTIILNGSTVSQWNDKSGNGRHASQPTAANQPTYNLNGLNGKTVLTFDGSSDFMTAGTNSTWNFLHNGQESAAFVVARAGNTGQDPNAVYTILTNGGAATADVGLWWAYEDRVLLSANNAFRATIARGVGDSSSASMSVNNQITPGAWNILGLRADADNPTAANRLIGNVNGGTNIATSVVTTAPSTANSSFPLYLGAYAFNPSAPTIAGFLLGAMAEVVMTNATLSTADRQRLEGYLAWRWGLEENLPTNHPFKFAPPFA